IAALATAGRLQTLREPANASKHTVDIFLIPGIGTTSPNSWPFASQEWLSTLSEAGAGARIIAYEYASPFVGTKPAWESVLMQGYDLLQQLSDSRLQSE
ncbi:MAG: hypothetical protein FE78DRAFT_131714, partial [Acidomyces sp. 'richmondensis']